MINIIDEIEVLREICHGISDCRRGTKIGCIDIDVTTCIKLWLIGCEVQIYLTEFINGLAATPTVNLERLMNIDRFYF